MVAKLMPQKLEITTPTDGLSDDRIEALITLAERMAALKAGVSPSMTIEGQAVLLEGEGGSPRAGDTRGEVIDVAPYTTDNPKHPLDLPPPAPVKLSSLRAETVYDDPGLTTGQTATEPTEPKDDNRKAIPKIGPGEIPTTKLSSLKPALADDEDDIDPATLF